MQLEAEQEIDVKSKELKKLKEWQGANFLVSVTFISFLLTSYYAGTWGLVSKTPDELKIFPQAFVIYLFSKLMPNIWLQCSLAVFFLLSFYFDLLNSIDIRLGYFLGLMLAILVLNKLKWPFWLLAPLSIHFVGIVFVYMLDTLSSQGGFELIKFLNKVLALSKESITFEMLLVYPVVFLSIQLNRLLNVFRILE